MFLVSEPGKKEEMVQRLLLAVRQRGCVW